MKRSLKRNQNNIALRKVKLLSKQRAARDIPDHVLGFLVEVERCSIYFKITAENVFNHDDTQVFLGLDRFVSIESATKEKSMQLGRKGTSLGMLLAIVGANGRFWLTVWVLDKKGENSTYTTILQTWKQGFWMTGSANEGSGVIFSRIRHQAI